MEMNIKNLDQVGSGTDEKSFKMSANQNSGNQMSTHIW
jgi:hypothetical protein